MDEEDVAWIKENIPTDAYGQFELVGAPRHIYPKVKVSSFNTEQNPLSKII